MVAERDLEWRPELVGVARYEPWDQEDAAEVAIVIQDYWQGRGLGAILLNELLRAGDAAGIRRFHAYVLADNHRMLTLLARHTDVQAREPQDGVIHLVFTRRNVPLEV